MKRTGIRSRSKRTEARADERRAAIDTAARRDRYTCQALLVLAHDCSGGLSPHEPHKRSGGGDGYDPDQILTVCWWANCWVEREPDEARRVGLSVHAWETWSWTADWVWRVEGAA